MRRKGKKKQGLEKRENGETGSRNISLGKRGEREMQKLLYEKKSREAHKYRAVVDFEVAKLRQITRTLEGWTPTAVKWSGVDVSPRQHIEGGVMDHVLNKQNEQSFTNVLNIFNMLLTPV